MKYLLFFPIALLLLLNFNGCAHKGDDPVSPEIQNTPDGLWHSEGIIFYNGSPAELSWNFNGGELIWDNKSYIKSFPENKWIQSSEQTYTFRYTLDNSFIIIPPVSGNPLWEDTLFYHYKTDGNKMTLDNGRILKGNSNSFTGTIWKARETKFIFNNDNTGYFISEAYGISDSAKLNYKIEGNILSFSYDQHGSKTSHTWVFEVKDQKLYIYDKPDAVQTQYSSEKLSQSIILYRSTPESETTDFFPLKKGNSWSFNYYYSPANSSGRENISGKLNWEIISGLEANTNNTFIYTVRETFSGIRVRYSSSADTTKIGPDTAYFNITEDALHRITINSTLTALGNVQIKRYYSQSTPDSITVQAMNHTNHRIAMKKAEGVKSWDFGGAFNSDLFGTLKLTRAILVKEQP